jgi:hypothetical protein
MSQDAERRAGKDALRAAWDHCHAGHGFDDPCSWCIGLAKKFDAAIAQARAEAIQSERNEGQVRLANAVWKARADAVRAERLKIADRLAATDVLWARRMADELRAPTGGRDES